MKIKMLVSIAGHAMPQYGVADFAFLPGQVLDIDDRLAKIWIQGGHAVAYTESAQLHTPETAMVDHQPAKKPRGRE